jgi:hypothetical protein
MRYGKVLSPASPISLAFGVVFVCNAPISGILEVENSR